MKLKLLKKTLIGIGLLAPITILPIVLTSCQNEIKTTTEQTTIPISQIKENFPINEINENDSSINLKSFDLKNKNELYIPSFAKKDNKDYKVKITNDFINELKTKQENIHKIRFGAFVDLNSIFDSTNSKPGVNFLFKSLREVVFEEGITSIPQYSFGLNQNLTNVVLPNTITTVGVQAFKDTNISKITLPSSLKMIESQAFSNAKLNEVVFEPGSNTSLTIGSKVFESNLFTKFTFPTNIKVLNFDYSVFDKNFIFQNCKNLKDVFSSEVVKNSFASKYSDDVQKLN